MHHIFSYFIMSYAAMYFYSFPSGNRLHSYGKSQSVTGEAYYFLWSCSIASHYQKVIFNILGPRTNHHPKEVLNTAHVLLQFTLW